MEHKFAHYSCRVHFASHTIWSMNNTLVLIRSKATKIYPSVQGFLRFFSKYKKKWSKNSCFSSVIVKTYTNNQQEIENNYITNIVLSNILLRELLEAIVLKLLGGRGEEGGGVASNLEHLPVYRAPRKGEGRSAPVHGQGTLRPGPCKKKIAWEGDTQHTDKHRNY